MRERFSHWRHLSPVEVTVLAVLFGGGLAILLLPAPFTLLVRLGLALGLLAAGGTTALQLHVQLQERQWMHYRRELTGFFLGYSIVLLAFPPVVTDTQPKLDEDRTLRYRERSKQLCISLGFSDPRLLDHIDRLANGGEEAREQVRGDLLQRLRVLFTARERAYFNIWYYTAAFENAVTRDWRAYSGAAELERLNTQEQELNALRQQLVEGTITEERAREQLRQIQSRGMQPLQPSEPGHGGVSSQGSGGTSATQDRDILEWQEKRDRAAQTLKDSGDQLRSALAKIRRDRNPYLNRELLWALERLASPGVLENPMLIEALRQLMSWTQFELDLLWDRLVSSEGT